MEEKYLDKIATLLERIVEQNVEAIALCKQAAATSEAWMDEMRLHWQVDDAVRHLATLLQKLRPLNPKEPQQ